MKVCKHYWLICLMVILGFSGITLVGSHIYSAVTVFAENAAGPQTTIILDPGHGGEDGGAVSCTGVLESQINLEISQRLDSLLQLLGYRTQMLRREDVSLSSGDAHSYSEKKVSDLKNRVQMINSVSDAVVVSIHQNHFPESKYRGAQVFYAANPQSQAMAELAQENLRTALDQTNHRQIKPAEGIFIMEEIQCPGILVECGFLSNPAEEALLREADYQKKVAAALAATLGNILANNREV